MYSSTIRPSLKIKMVALPGQRLLPLLLLLFNYSCNTIGAALLPLLPSPRMLPSEVFSLLRGFQGCYCFLSSDSLLFYAPNTPRQHQRQQQHRRHVCAAASSTPADAFSHNSDNQRCRRKYSSDSRSANCSSSTKNWFELLGQPYRPVSEGELQQQKQQLEEQCTADMAFSETLKEVQDDPRGTTLFGLPQQQQLQQQEGGGEPLDNLIGGLIDALPYTRNEDAVVSSRSRR